MPMQTGFRWYGEGNDNISLSDIKQIPGVTETSPRPVIVTATVRRASCTCLAPGI